MLPIIARFSLAKVSLRNAEFAYEVILRKRVNP